MLYKKSSSLKLDLNLFKKPTAEYRGTPFWAWNSSLEKETLAEQIESFKKMGFGGFHIHSRTGMAVDYLSEEFMELVKFCEEKAEKENMLLWLYDEDRWPSGSAGGIVTKDIRFRARKLCLSSERKDSCFDYESAYTQGTPFFLAAYDINLNEDGTIENYTIIDFDENALGLKKYVYILTDFDTTGWYNGQGYVDTLSKKAIDKFIDVTYNNYKKYFGDKFGSNIPAIFTDEPQFAHKEVLRYPEDQREINIPWTFDFDKTFKEKYNYDILERLPEVFWEIKSHVSTVRYHYHDHICDRFTEAYAANCGAWCSENGILFTGHMMDEPTLESQTCALGEAMRAYPHFGIPGIDMLCNRIELATAKQAQSIVHQYKKEGMLSELYGVTGWDFDFRGYKYQGDWQAALGVTIRVPHLAYYSMKGNAKRDFPGSIGYQSPWYSEFSYLEDHYARLNTVLTRGNPVVKIGVIHPIESYWLHFGPLSVTSDIREKKEKEFSFLIECLISGLQDFDFISESLLSEQETVISDKITIGHMQYDVILVPGCETLRNTTFQILKQFQNSGGKVIFIGESPKYIDACPNSDIHSMYKNSTIVNFEAIALLNALETYRIIDIKNRNGLRVPEYIYQLRDDSGIRWLFIAPINYNKDHFISKHRELDIIVKGRYFPEIYNTLSGNIESASYSFKNGDTIISVDSFGSDSYLFKLSEYGSAKDSKKEKSYITLGSVRFNHGVHFSRDEPNVALLDIAEYKIDDGEWQSEEEILRIDSRVREQLNCCRKCIQPWVLPNVAAKHNVTLKFSFCSEIEYNSAGITLENPEKSVVVFNGKRLNNNVVGYFTDKSIKIISIPGIKKGNNVIEITLPFGETDRLEWSYLLGDFDVILKGSDKIIKASSAEIGFQDIVNCGMPFYGGNIYYDFNIDVPEGTDIIRIKSGSYFGALINVELDGKEVGKIAFEPYILDIPDVSAGKHIITMKLYGNRYNCFGPIHNTDINYYGESSAWLSYGESWSYEYRLRPIGIFNSPIISFLKRIY